MGKIHLNLSVDEDLVKKAQDVGMNMSGEFERAIERKFVSCETDIPKEDGEKCAFCGKMEKKATRDNLKGLTWLCPDEVWICDSCLTNKIRRIVKVAL